MPLWRPALLTIAALAGAAAPARAQGPDILVFGTSHEADTIVFRYATDYLARLCAESLQRCMLQSLPGRRSEALLASGGIVGEVGRVKAYQHKHPDYVRVEEHFVVSRTYVFTRTDRPAIDHWDDLPHSVSYKRGLYAYQIRLESMRPRLQPHDVQSVPACLQMVLMGRDQACVFDDGSIGFAAKPLLAQGRIGKSLEDLELYIYLGKDNAELAKTMTAASRRLNAQGLRQQLRRKYFDER